MIHYLFLLLCYLVIDAKHFNGGTIRWIPADSYDNSSSTTITIIQSYSWSYPTVLCTTDVPISTPGYSMDNASLICVVDCSTDGGYSNNSVSILTNCTSSSSALGSMTSESSKNITLSSGAHFYLAYVGSAWRALNNPAQIGLEWSIVSLVDLRMRSDGFINTPPVASVVSPQYVVVNRKTEIQIHVSDANAGDHVRCRWAKYTPGYRRRKRSSDEKHLSHDYAAQIHKKLIEDEEISYSRKKRGAGGPCTNCTSTCMLNCPCSCAVCLVATCTGVRCMTNPSCSVATTTVATTTVETPGTLAPTSSYPNRQAIDECGGICFPSSMPNGTILSNCTLFFQGLVPNTWYGVAIQVEDFINETSTTPMSSVPIQFLIYVLPEPACSEIPVIIPLTGCLEVTVGVSQSFNLSVLNLCDYNTSNITSIILSNPITGMQIGNLSSSSTNESLVYVTLTWTPEESQIGLQQLCTVAYTSDQVQSDEYCVTFTVTTSSNICVTTTITTRSTTTSSASISVPTTAATTTFISMITSMPNTITTSTMSAAATATITTTATTTDNSGKSLFWGLIIGLSALGLALLLTLCCFCCLYYFFWSPAAKHRRQVDSQQASYLYSSMENMPQTSSNTNRIIRIEIPRQSFQAYNILPKTNITNSSYMIIKRGATTSNNGKWPLYRVPVAIQN